MHKQTKKLRKLMHNNKSSEEAMVPLSLENFKLKSKQTTTFKNSENLRADLHGERERERERERASNALVPISKTKFSIEGSWHERGSRASNDLVPISKTNFSTPGA
jgi:hypothetical protein